MRILAFFAAIAVLGANAYAAPIMIANADFESDVTLDILSPLGNVTVGTVPGWTLNASGVGGIWAPSASGLASSFPSGAPDIGDQVAFLNSGAGLYQLTGTTVASDTSYTLSVLFGNRSELAFGGVFGLYAQDAAGNITRMLEAVLTDPGVGLMAVQSLSLNAEAAQNFLGQTIGIFFISTKGQVIFDNVALDAQTIVNPLPAAFWLFGTVLLGGFSRRFLKRA